MKKDRVYPLNQPEMIMSKMISNVEYTSTMIDVRDESTNYLVGKIFEVNYFGLTRIKFSIYLIKGNFDSIEIVQNNGKDLLQILSPTLASLNDIFDELCSHRMILIIIDMILSITYSKGDLSEYIKMIEEELSEKGFDSFDIYDEFS